MESERIILLDTTADILSVSLPAGGRCIVTVSACRGIRLWRGDDGLCATAVKEEGKSSVDLLISLAMDEQWSATPDRRCKNLQAQYFTLTL